MTYLPRLASEKLRSQLAIFPCVLVLGPRQCGKSTLVSREFPEWLHLDLERPADRDLLAADLEGFFDAHPRQVAIDEAQRVPDLFPLLRYVIDKLGSGPGRFILTGSSSPVLWKSVSESLAGRIGRLELTPFLACEVHPDNRWFWGGFPRVSLAATAEGRREWLGNYLDTFFERDVPEIAQRLQPERLRKFLTMLTHVHGGLANFSELARSLEVSVPTVTSYVDLLQGTFMVRRLQPFHANIEKRLTRSPKLYIRDSGVLHHLAGLRSPADLDTWHLRGRSFEGLVIEELCARASLGIPGAEHYFWRTRAGAEVDLLVKDGRRLYPIEIKLGASVTRSAVTGLKQCMADLSLDRGWVVYTGREVRKLGTTIDLLPWEGVVRGTVPLPWDQV